MNVKGLDYTCLTLSIIGAINWGLIGIFRFDLVAFLFGKIRMNPYHFLCKTFTGPTGWSAS